MSALSPTKTSGGSPSRRRELLIAFFLLAATVWLGWSRILDPLELLTLDLRFRLRGERPFPPGVALVKIDEMSLDHPKSGPWPWPRGRHAEFLYSLERDPVRPAAIGYDLFFEDENLKDEPGDTAFVYRAGEAGGRIVLGYFFEKGYQSRYERSTDKEARLRSFALPVSGGMPPRLEKFDKVSLPFLKLSQAGALGFSNISRDAQGATRRLRLLGLYQGRVYPSLELMLYMRSLGVDPRQVRVTRDAVILEKDARTRRVIPVTPEGEIWIDYYGHPRPPLHEYSFIQTLYRDTLLAPDEERKMERALKNKIVLVGRTALSLGDTYATPFEQNQPGIFVRAQALANLLEGRSLRRADPKVSAAVLAAFGFLVIFALMRLSLLKAFLALAGLAGAYFLLAGYLFARAYWIDLAVPVIALPALFTGVVCFRYFTALEEIRRTQQQLLHSTRMAMIGEVSSGMAHEFRNILHAIKLHVEGCARPGMSPERVQRYMGVIFRTMTNAEQILNGILTFSRKSQSDLKPGSLKKTVEDTLLLLKRELQYQNIQLTAHLDSVGLCDHDSGQISQVIMNLLNNARDALRGQEQKVVVIRLREDAGGQILDLGDNGPGIPKEVLKNLFQPFVTTKGEGQGTGLGLSVCQKIMENHGGKITVTTAPGQGTIWHLHFPKKL